MAQQIELPTQSNLHSNKPSSLYHTCLTVLDKLACIPGFDYYQNQDVTTPTSLTIPSPTSTIDPVSKLWNICRKGSSLCFLFNNLRPNAPVKVNEDASLTSANACKANVYHFIVGCQKELHFSDDDLFTICDLTQDDTNGFVKVRVSTTFASSVSKMSSFLQWWYFTNESAPDRYWTLCIGRTYCQ